MLARMGRTDSWVLLGYLTAHLSSMSAFCCQGVLGWFPDPFWPRTLSQSLLFSSQIHESGPFTQLPAMVASRPGLFPPLTQLPLPNPSPTCTLAIRFSQLTILCLGGLL